MKRVTIGMEKIKLQTEQYGGLVLHYPFLKEEKEVTIKLYFPTNIELEEYKLAVITAHVSRSNFYIVMLSSLLSLQPVRQEAKTNSIFILIQHLPQLISQKVTGFSVITAQLNHSPQPIIKCCITIALVLIRFICSFVINPNTT